MADYPRLAEDQGGPTLRLGPWRRLQGASGEGGVGRGTGAGGLGRQCAPSAFQRRPPPVQTAADDDESERHGRKGEAEGPEDDNDVI